MIDEKEKLISRLNKSGHNLHLRTVNRLENPGGEVGKRVKFDEVKVCPYFEDNVSGKNREIDIVAQRSIPGNKILRLFIECKYLKNFGNADDDVVKSLAFYEIDYSLKNFQKILCNRYHLDYSEECHGGIFRCLEDSGNRQNEFYGQMVGGSKIAIICEPYKELYDAVDTCIKAKLFAKKTQNSQDFIDYFIIVVDSSCKLFRINKNHSFSDGYKNNNLKEIDNEILLVNYPGPGLGGNQCFIEIIKEDKLENIILQMYLESEKIISEFQEMQSFNN